MLKVTEKNETLAVVELEGFLEFHTALPLRLELTALVENGCRSLVLDMESVTYLDSSVIGALISVFSMLRRKNGVLYLVSLSEQIKKLLIATRLISFFKIAKNIEDARAEMSRLPQPIRT